MITAKKVLKAIYLLLLCILSFSAQGSYQYDATFNLVSSKNTELNSEKFGYDDTPNFHYCCNGSVISSLQKKTQGGSFFAFKTGLVGAKEVGQLTRTFSLNGSQVPILGGNPVVGRTLRNGLTEVKTSVTGTENDAANVFRSLVGDSAKALSNGKGFRSVLDDGREFIFRPVSSGRSGGIPKIEIRDFNSGVSEKINFVRGG